MTIRHFLVQGVLLGLGNFGLLQADSILLGIIPVIAESKMTAAELITQLAQRETVEAKVIFLQKICNINDVVNKNNFFKEYYIQAGSEEKYALLSLCYINQLNHLLEGAEKAYENPQNQVRAVVSTLVQINQFYAHIGGLIGYNDTLLKLLIGGNTTSKQITIASPPLIDMRKPAKREWSYCKLGNALLPECCEIYVVGGAGDRLKLVDPKTRTPLPVAKLVFRGKTLLQRLFDDVEARECWYYKTTGKQLFQSIVLMTSLEKDNDRQIEKMCQENDWFGRPKESIYRMVQPQVPLIDKNGRWVLSNPLELALRPGGHGVMWKLGFDSGVFQTLLKSGVRHSLVRQINNPLVGCDTASYSLLGYGAAEEQAFGFASCPQHPGFAEGMIVLKKNLQESYISNIEYTEFEKLKREKPELFQGHSPANVNFLYCHLPSIAKAIESDPIPGMLVNAKTEVESISQGKSETILAARLESTMQNISDAFKSPGPKLQTFVQLFDRDKIMSVTKRAPLPEALSETPISCLHDYLESHKRMLLEYTESTLPSKQSFSDFVTDGPNFVFDFHPALGPLWAVIGQKIHSLHAMKSSKLVLNIAEVNIDTLKIDGTCIIDATRVTKAPTVDGMCYSDNVGRVHFKNVTIRNSCKVTSHLESILNGTDDTSNACHIRLDGSGEVAAQDITISGAFTLVVPDKMKAILRNDKDGNVLIEMTPCPTPSWRYHVEWVDGVAPQLSLI